MQRGDVWLINLEPTIGAEIRKMRPAIIVNDNGIGLLPLRVIVTSNRLERTLFCCALDGAD